MKVGARPRFAVAINPLQWIVHPMANMVLCQRQHLGHGNVEIPVVFRLECLVVDGYTLHLGDASAFLLLLLIDDEQVWDGVNAAKNRLLRRHCSPKHLVQVTQCRPTIAVSSFQFNLDKIVLA